jgi:DNA-binding MarR family transcriptional regulator
MGRIRRDDPDSSIGFLISDVARMLRRVYDRRVEPLGLTRAQWRVLVHLHRREGVSQTALAQFLEIEKPTLGRLVDRLEEKGWIERQVDDRDQRARRLVLAEAVRPMIAEMETMAEAVHDDALAGLGADGERRLRRALLTVKANLAHEIANGNGGREDDHD